MKKTNTTLKKTLTLLDAFEATQFLDKAPLSLRRAAHPLFNAIILHCFWRAEHPLPSNDEVASAEQALAKHQASIAAGQVEVVPGTPRGQDWLTTLPDEAEAIVEKLEREDSPVMRPAAALTESAPIPVVEPPAPNASVNGAHAGSTLPSVGQSVMLDAGKDADAVDANMAESPENPSVAWERPVELAEAYGPDFPVRALAEWHQRFVMELAEQVQIPVDVPALASLGMIGAAVAKTVTVQIQPGDEQPTNFWALVVSPPGDGKTPLLGELRRPFDQAQDTLRDLQRADAARAETEHRIDKVELNRLVREAATSDDAEERADLTTRAVELTRRLDMRRTGSATLMTGDCTQLGLLKLMNGNKGRLLLLTDEGDQLFSRVQQRSPQGAEDIDDMLKAYSGATIDRHDAQSELRIPGAALSIVATTQPRPFAKVMGVEAYHSKGFMGRFALALPRSIQGARKQRRAAVSEEARSTYQGVLRELLARPIPDAPSALTLSEEAFQVFAACGEEADRELMTNRDASFRAWLGKLRGLTARLAGILHVSDPANRALDVISGETMTRAVEIAQYLSAHARVAYEQSERAALDEDPRRLLRWIRDTQRREFTHAEAVLSFSGRLNARDIQTCIERLVAAKYLRERPAGRSRGGRPRKPSYTVNPCVFRSS